MDAFGNAVGNAIVAGRVQANVDERNAMLKLQSDFGNATLKDAYKRMAEQAAAKQNTNNTGATDLNDAILNYSIAKLDAKNQAKSSERNAELDYIRQSNNEFVMNSDRALSSYYQSQAADYTQGYNEQWYSVQQALAKDAWLMAGIENFNVSTYVPDGPKTISPVINGIGQAGPWSPAYLRSADNVQPVRTISGDAGPWQIKQMPTTPGPWREGLVQEGLHSNMTAFIQGAGMPVGAINSTINAMKGLAATKYGSFGVGLLKREGWTLLDGATTLASLDGGFGRATTMPIDGWGANSHYIGTAPANQLKTGTPSLFDLTKSNTFKLIEKGGQYLGPAISLANALDYQFYQNNGQGHCWDKHGIDNLSNWTKFGVDASFAVAAGVGGGVPAGLYAITDFALLATGYNYTPQYHPQEFGKPKSSWTGVGYQYFETLQPFVERNQSIDPNWQLKQFGGL